MTARAIWTLLAVCGALILGGYGVWGCVAYWPDYGACLQSHQEPRHSNAWTELRTVTCGKDCSTTIPIYHPAEDWVVTVCDRYEYPDACGPRAGYRRKADCR